MILYIGRPNQKKKSIVSQQLTISYSYQVFPGISEVFGLFPIQVQLGSIQTTRKDTKNMCKEWEEPKNHVSQKIWRIYSSNETTILFKTYFQQLPTKTITLGIQSPSENGNGT